MCYIMIAKIINMVIFYNIMEFMSIIFISILPSPYRKILSYYFCEKFVVSLIYFWVSNLANKILQMIIFSFTIFLSDKTAIAF